MPAAGPTNGVICQRCHKPIRLERTDRVAEEFSVACPHCGWRGIYRIKDIKPLESELAPANAGAMRDLPCRAIGRAAHDFPAALGTEFGNPLLCAGGGLVA